MAGMLTVNFDNSKIFVWDNRFNKATYTNGTGSPVTLALGRLLGRISSSQKVTGHVSTATDGSEQPIGVLADDYTVAPGASVVVTFCDGGDVAQEKLILGGSDTLATLIGTGAVPSIQDAISRNTQIKLVAATELNAYDNQ